ncbi:acyltransferase [Amycolatopsis alkalitolerans]|uniref:Acyltransferase n=1 Tax=Amycolatopsis alkalitolerans TaxID=2547244 RepID=A0A5C4M8I7_9PSEU|nr:acyltransferase [Amycolatopsis alkalitolerans]
MARLAGSVADRGGLRGGLDRARPRLPADPAARLARARRARDRRARGGGVPVRPTAARGCAVSRPDRLHGLDLLRVLASCLVIYEHIAAYFTLSHQHWWLTDWAEAEIVGGLHLNALLGFLGVCTFLMISGVVVTHVTAREGPWTFLYRRVSRLMPLLWVVTPLVWLLINFGLQVSSTRDPRLDLGDLLSGMVLWNFFQRPQIGLVGSTWTLWIQLIFYCYVAAAIPLLRRRPWLPPAIMAPVCFVAILLSTLSRNSTTGSLHMWAHQIGQWAVYLTVLCIGQLISLVHARAVHRYVALAIGAVHVLLFIWADRIGGFTFQGTAMPRTLLVVTAVVLLMMRANGRVSRSRVIAGWSRRTYAIYLVHLACMYPLMNLLVPRVGPELGVLAGLAAAAFVSEVLHRFVEMPAERFLRSRRRQPRRTPDDGEHGGHAEQPTAEQGSRA